MIGCRIIVAAGAASAYSKDTSILYCGNCGNCWTAWQVKVKEGGKCSRENCDAPPPFSISESWGKLSFDSWKPKVLSSVYCPWIYCVALDMPKLQLKCKMSYPSIYSPFRNTRSNNHRTRFYINFGRFQEEKLP
jgi:hypothetical protein